jgi:excisionase family DNA binding protein
MQKKFLNLQEAAELLDISTRALREAAIRGEIPAKRIARQWRFSRPALHAWLATTVMGQKDNSYLKAAGLFADNPLWPEVAAYMKSERQRQRQAVKSVKSVKKEV